MIIRFAPNVNHIDGGRDSLIENIAAGAANHAVKYNKQLSLTVNLR